MSTVLKFTDPNGGAIYLDIDDSLVVSVDDSKINKPTKITNLNTGEAFYVSESPELVCSLLEGLQRAK